MATKSKYSSKKNHAAHIIMVIVAAVLVWRGLWGLMDLYIFPNYPLYSYVTSLVAGLVLIPFIGRFTLEELE